MADSSSSTEQAVYCHTVQVSICLMHCLVLCCYRWQARATMCAMVHAMEHVRACYASAGHLHRVHYNQTTLPTPSYCVMSKPDLIRSLGINDCWLIILDAIETMASLELFCVLIPHLSTALAFGDSLLLCKLLPLGRLSWLGNWLCSWQRCCGRWQLRNPANVGSFRREGKQLRHQSLSDSAGNGQASCVRVCCELLCIDWAGVEGCQVAKVEVKLALKSITARQHHHVSHR